MNERKLILRNWVNARTNKDKFSALHYSSFRGNIDICKVLIELGADINVLNQHGLSVVHIAAQGDQP